MTTSEQTEQTILIVDDNPTNLGVLADYLEDYGFDILTAMDGEDSLNTVFKIKPDIILLDVMMPGIDGFEVCRRLKAAEATRDIPVIFMTALAGEDDKIKGFDVGAVDYVTKPIQQREVLARVITHLHIQAQTKQLQQQAEKLAIQTEKLQSQAEELQAKNQQLVELNVSKDKFFSIVAHDLKGPFVPLLGDTEQLAEVGNTYTPEQVEKVGKSLHRTAKNTFNLLETLLQWARIQMGRIEYLPSRLNLTNIIDQTINLLTEVAFNKQIVLQNKLQIPVYLYADENMLKTIIRNLINNALKFTPNGGQVIIGAQKQPQNPKFVELWVSDTGVGISQINIEKLFKIGEHHTTLGTDEEKGTGLGLTMCYEMVEKHGGQIWVESEVGQGTTFRVTLPADGELPEGDWLSEEALDYSRKVEILITEKTTYIVPPAELLAKLHHLAKRGNMKDIRLWTERIMAMDEQYRPFAEQIEVLAKQYDGQGIKVFVEQYL
ncbi:hybrid sensor histidine kinase/response regulator [Anaerolineales bacterium HSG24]|nr:hybrid sensor histidine kinase/response regulator [Anaerolineales bacterium HSG24]